jgi:hypothetical protein
MVAGIIFGLRGLDGARLLPFRSAGLLAFNTGSGTIGATTVGLLGGVATLALGQLHFTLARVLARTPVAFLFAVPPAYAGYCAPHSVWHGTAYPLIPGATSSLPLVPVPLRQLLSASLPVPLRQPDMRIEVAGFALQLEQLFSVAVGDALLVGCTHR